MQGTVGVGIFGCNSFTKVLVPLLKEKGFNVLALWGRHLNETQEYAKLLQIEYYSNKIEEVLLQKKDIVLLFILTQPFLHSMISVKCLGIGKHVFCLAPIGIGVSDAQKMLNASEYYPKLISVINHSLRFLPAITQLKKALSENYIGDIYCIDVNVKACTVDSNESYDWIHDSHMGGGVVALVGSHVIDLIHFITGKKANRVHGIVRTFRQQTESIQGIRQISAPDFTTFQMELENGILVTANIKSNNYGLRNSFDQEVTVMGSSGNLVVVGGDLTCFKKKSSTEFKEEKLYVEIQDMRTSESLYIKGLNKMLTVLKESFTSSSSETWNKKPVSSAANFSDGLYVQTVIDCIQKSSESRAWIKIESPNLKN